MKIEWVLSIGYSNCKLYGEINMPDDATDEEISEAVQDDANNFIDLSWKIKVCAEQQDSKK